MEQFMFTYLNQRYGLKQLIVEWAASLVQAIKLYTADDVQVHLFGKMLKNVRQEVEQQKSRPSIITKYKGRTSRKLETACKECGLKVKNLQIHQDRPCPLFQFFTKMTL